MIEEHGREGLAKVGLSDEEIERIAATVGRMKASGEAEPSTFRLSEAIMATGAQVTAATMVKAQPIYLRALGEALLKTDERYRDDPLDFGAEIVFLSTEADSLSVEERAVQPIAPADPE